MKEDSTIDFLLLREALEASWDSQTSYLEVEEAGNPALGSYYPTSRVVQYFFPKTEIVKGKVWTGEKLEIHFWNVLPVGDDLIHIDLSWQQFPHGSSVKSFKILYRNKLGDSDGTTKRCDLLRTRVLEYMNKP